MCSGIKDQLSSFNDEVVNLKSHLRENCTLLLFAECTHSPHFAVFMTRLAATQLYGFKVYHGRNYIEYWPDSTASMHRVTINGVQMALQSSSTLTMSALELDKIMYVYKYSKLLLLNRICNILLLFDSVYMTEENILVIQVFADVLIQYDMKDIFTIQRLNENKERLCGLCNLPLNSLDTYSYCT